MRLVQKTEINLVWPEYKFEFSCSENLDRWTEATSWKALCVILGKMDCPPECFYKNTFKTIHNFSKIIFSYLKAIHIQSNFLQSTEICRENHSYLVTFTILNILIYTFFNLSMNIIMATYLKENKIRLVLYIFIAS